MFQIYNKTKLPPKFPLKNGNRKIGKNTIILNFGCALTCKSNKKNLCHNRSICYALRDELRYYKNTIKYRREQELYFNKYDSKTISEEIKEYAENLKYDWGNSVIKYVRFSEGGDFKDQKQLNKFIEICELLPDLVFYGYTHRSDLDFTERPNNLIINGSGFMVDNSFEVVNKFKLKDVVCLNDCRICNLCKVKGNREIKVLKH